MSKPRYDWWPYVKGMVRRYPALCREYADPNGPAADGFGAPPCGRGGNGRQDSRRPAL